MLPTFLVIGAEKSGTTWLYERLRRHPGIFMPLVKELHYFNRRDSNLEPARNFEDRGREWYEYHFRGAKNGQSIGEVTPMYLCDEAAPERIHRAIPNVKLIACLRHPTDRAHSHYWMAKGKKHTSLSFEDVVEQREERFIERGRYARQLVRYLNYFNRDQLLILIHEEVVQAPSESLNRVCSFLGVDDTFYRDQPWITETVHSSSAERSILLHRAIGGVAKWMRGHWGTRHVLDWFKKTGVAGQLKKANKKEREYPEMSCELRAELDEHYARTVRGVENLLDRRIQSWREKTTVEIERPVSPE